MENAEGAPRKKRRVALWIVVGIIVLIILFVALIGFITNMEWFHELGYRSVFLKKLFTQLEIGIPTFVVVTFLAYIYLKVLQRGYLKKVVSNDPVNTRRLNLISWGLAALYGIVTTYFAVTRLWFQWLEFSNSTDFKITDPLFNNDVSFYVFRLDFIQDLNGILIVLLIAFIILTLIYYAVLLGVRTPEMLNHDNESGSDSYDDDSDNQQGGFGGNMGGMFGKFAENFTGENGGFGGASGNGQGTFNRENISFLVSIAKRQLMIVGVLFFLMIGVNFFLRQYNLLFGSTGAVYGAGFTDVNVTLWEYRVIMVLSIAAAIGVIIGINRKRIRPVIIVPIIMICVGILGAIAGAVVQNLVVTPDEINKESKYLDSNITFTQYAYGLDNVESQPFAASKDLNSDDIANNEETISNIRINDYQPTLQFYNQTQAIRQYYSFNNVNVDRYTIDGEYTQTFLSTREIDETAIKDTWLNNHIKYTHGYGVDLSRVDKVTSSGQPDVLIENIPPESSVDIQVTQPEVYFGELTNNYVMVNTSEDEFDYPNGDDNVYTQYEGKAGIKLNLVNRFMFAVRERSLKLLVSSNIKSNSKILINRNIETRVKTIMPYLAYDEDPYMTIVDGKLYWIIDAYTTSSNYPYSEPYSSDSKDNYIRNSIKVVIDAYNGDTDYYIVDDTDPIAKTFQSIYPALFKELDDMPEGLQAHIRYPSTMLNIQAEVYQRYHMSDVKVFYQNEDYWAIANEIYGTEEQTMESNYYILKLPGEDSAEFVNSIPFTPKDKNNLTGLLVARNDGDNYGQLMLYKMPKSKTVYGPMQIEAQIDQNTQISQDFSLWDSSGSTYSRGNMFVIPIEDSLLYIEPVYLEASNSSIPEVKRVIVIYGDKIAYEPTLAEALNSMFGDGTVKEDSSSSTKSTSSKKSSKKSSDKDSLSQSEIIDELQEAFDNAQNAQQDGDWAGYGDYLDEMEEYLDMLNK